MSAEVDDRPEPLVPADVDLRDFGFMPLEVQRLRDSEVASVEDAEVFRANLLSWCAAWHQVPAATLPDDDATLARLLGYGRDQRTWKRLRLGGGLRHWFRASDGRLHHPIVAEKALEAWIDKLLQRKSSGAGNAKRWGGEFDPEVIDAALAAAAEFLTRLNPQSRTLHRKLPKMRTGSPTGGPGGNAAVAITDSQGTGTETDKRQGQGLFQNDAAASQRPTNRAGPGTSIPEGLTLTDEWRTWAEEARAKRNLPAVDLDLEFDRFSNYYRARRKLMNDWKAAWRSWAISQYVQAPTTRAGSISASSKLEAGHEAMRIVGGAA